MEKSKTGEESEDNQTNDDKASTEEPEENLGLFSCFFDADLLAYKGFCFFLYGAYGGFIPFLTLYFKQLGIQANYAGTLVGIRPLIQCIGAPFFGVLANRFHAGKVLLLGGIFAWILKALMILAITPHDQHCIKLLENKTSNQTFVYAYNLWDFSSQEDNWVVLSSLNEPVLIKENKITVVRPEAKEAPEAIPNKIKKPLKQDKNPEAAVAVEAPTEGSNNSKRMHGKLHSSKEDDPAMFARPFQKRKLLAVDAPEKDFLTFADLGKKITTVVKVLDQKLNMTIEYITQIDTVEVQNMYVTFLLVIIIGEFLESPAYGLSDASLLKRLGPNRDYYGRIRMWGSLGWMVAALLVGSVTYSASFYLCGVLTNNYILIFYVFIAMVAAAFVNALWYKFDYSNADADPKDRSAKLGQLAEKVMRARHVCFLVGVLYIGFCYGLLVHFVNWYVDDLGGSPLIMGVNGAARELAGIAFFFLSGPMIRSLGNLNTLLLSVAAYVVCFLCFAVLDNPWVAPLLELLDGATYALAWSNSVSYMGMIGDPIGMVETTQGTCAEPRRTSAPHEIARSSKGLATKLSRNRV